MAASLDLQGGREAEAARAYQKFLAHPGAMHVGEDKVAEARQRLDELKAKLPARITIVTEPSGAQIAVNGVLQSGTSPLMLELPAGPHRIEATLPGRQRAEAELQLQGGDELEQRLLLPEEPTAAPAPPASEPPPPALEPSERSMLPAYITLGLAGAGLATGTVFGIQALSARSAYNDDPTASRADRVERNALIADMAFGIAITLGITGIVLLTSSDDTPQTAKAKKKQPTLAVAPVVAPQLGGAAARLTFCGPPRRPGVRPEPPGAGAPSPQGTRRSALLLIRAAPSERRRPIGGPAPTYRAQEKRLPIASTTWP